MRRWRSSSSAEHRPASPRHPHPGKSEPEPRHCGANETNEPRPPALRCGPWHANRGRSPSRVRFCSLPAAARAATGPEQAGAVGTEVRAAAALRLGRPKAEPPKAGPRAARGARWSPVEGRRSAEAPRAATEALQTVSPGKKTRVSAGASRAAYPTERGAPVTAPRRVPTTSASPSTPMLSALGMSASASSRRLSSNLASSAARRTRRA